MKRCAEWARLAVLAVLIFGIIWDWNDYILAGLSSILSVVSYIEGLVEGMEAGK